MKKLIYIFLVSMVTITSCNEYILDKEPLDIMSDAAVFQDQTLIDAYLTQAYLEMYMLVNETPTPIAPESEWASSADWYGPFIIAELSDEATGNWLRDKPSYVKYGGIQIHGGVLEWWEYSYKVIRTLNYFLERIEDATVNEDFRKSRAAEARFLRAYNYFAMVKRYGGVPLITVAQSIGDSDEELFRTRDKEQDIYDFVIAEMDAIADDLDMNDLGSGRPVKAAALALKSRAALYAASIAQFGEVQLDGILGIQSPASEYYQKSYDASQKIISSAEFALYDQDADKVQNFKNLFIVKNNSEAIWTVRHNDIVWMAGQSSGNGWTWDFFQAPKPHAWNAGNVNAPYLEMAESFEYVDGTPGTLDRDAIQQGLWTMDALWSNRDPRFYASIYTQGTPWQGDLVDFHNGLIKPDGTYLEEGSYEGVLVQGNQSVDGSFGTSFGVMKCLDESHSNTGERGTSQSDWMLFRYAEVLLNHAEAALELGKDGEALDAINQIRSRAGIATLGAIDRDKIRHERKIELAFEGHRYWDLRRWRVATDVLTVNRSGIRYVLDYTTGDYQIFVIENMDGSIADPIFNEHHYYFPITIARTGNNANLVENPGYH